MVVEYLPLTFTVTSGSNVFTVVAVPNDDQCTSLEETITLVVGDETNQCTDPTVQLVIDTPVNGTSTSASSIIVSWSVTETGVTVTVNGNTVTIDDQGNFSSAINLSVWSNNIVVRVITNDEVCDLVESIVVTRTWGGWSWGGGWGNGWGINSCGDGVVRNGEQCDDGNNRNGDGCSRTCEIEWDIVSKIKKKKIETILKEKERTSTPLSFAPPRQLAATGDFGGAAGKRALRISVLQQYTTRKEEEENS